MQLGGLSLLQRENAGLLRKSECGRLGEFNYSSPVGRDEGIKRILD
jgi:hypothetical protein